MLYSPYGFMEQARHQATRCNTRTEERVMLATLFFGLLGVTFAAMIVFHTQLLAIHGGTV